jgi:predicted AAA+ superfamily ATPase
MPLSPLQQIGNRLPENIDYRQPIADNSCMFARILDLKAEMRKKSHFLLGPRATGKSWLIRNQLLPGAQIFDLLNTDTFSRLLRRPHSLSEEIHSPLVVIDEVQKLPRLLDEAHRLIEEKGIRFLLTGSSARKLKHGGANLLAGRARSLPMFPLTRREIGADFKLEEYCNRGGLPLVWQSDDYWADLREYTQLYLKEEIIAEAVVRKVDHYARFLDVIGRCSGEELHYQQISSDSGVPVRTVANFVEILRDTLLAFELSPFEGAKGRKVSTKSKIYMFDVGVANYLSGRKQVLTGSDAFGKSFEHFVIQEIRACVGYAKRDLPLCYWRTREGNFEVDCIVGDSLAVEIKSSDHFSGRSLAGLKALQSEKKVRRYFLVSRDPVSREVGGIEIMPYDKFLDALWAGELLS